MALPENAIIEATYEGVIHGQTVLNVYHYRVETVSAEISYIGEMTQFLDAFTDPQVGSMRTTFLTVVPSNYTLVRAVAQAVYPQRFRRVVEAVNDNGTVEIAQVTNLQASITTASIVAGRNQIGGKRLCISETAATSGLLTGNQLTAVNAHAEAMLDDLQPDAGGGVYRPVIFHRSPNANPKFNDIVIAFGQPQVRIIRRRTVGLGI